MFNLKQKFGQILEYFRLHKEYKIVERQANEVFWTWAHTWRPITQEYGLEQHLDIEDSLAAFGKPGYPCMVEKTGNAVYKLKMLVKIDAKSFRCPNFSNDKVCPNCKCMYHAANQEYVKCHKNLDDILANGAKIESVLNAARERAFGRQK